MKDFHGPKAGESFVEMELFDLSGQRKSLSEYLGKQPVVLETASLTSPTYVQALPHMRGLQQLYPDVLFLVLYVREAHPGRQLPAHQTMGDKMIAARQMVTRYDEKRVVLVDDLNGSSHQAYGGLPNMVYVFDKEGKVVFRGDWNRPGHLAYVLKGMMQGRQVFRRDYFSPYKPTAKTAVRSVGYAGVDALWQLVKSLPSLIRLCRLARLNYEHRLLSGMRW